MKLPPRLCLAVKQAIRIKQEALRAEHSVAVDDALIDFTETNRTVLPLVQRCRALEEERDKLIDSLAKMGLDLDHSGAVFIRDQSKFRKAGGKYPEKRLWVYEDVIETLLAATPEDGEDLLRQLGINWS